MTLVNNKVGFTSTIPVEVIFSSDHVPVDLNNLFVTHGEREMMLEEAEKKGMPRTVCSWIKGIYSLFRLPFERIIFVEGGDCSNTTALREVAEYSGIHAISFRYPLTQDRFQCLKAIQTLAEQFDVTLGEVNRVFDLLKPVRQKLMKLDRIGYEKPGLISSSRIFEMLVNSTDFSGSMENYVLKLDGLMAETEQAVYQRTRPVRIGICGVPPIFQDLYDYLEGLGGYVVYHEIPAEFAMMKGETIEEAYSSYTYPYGIFCRIKRISEEIKAREIDGIIHYVQSFCYRNIENIILKQEIDIPVLTFEGDSSFFLSPRDKLRLENFLEMIG